MKTILYWFSGTGNSLVVARDLAGALGGADVLPIASALRTPRPGSEADRIGIVFPVYMWGLPLLVAEFCRRLDPRPDAYLFGVATYGGSPGYALRQMAGLCRRRGLALSAGFGIRMPGNYTPLYGAISPARQQRQFEAEKRRITDIAQSVDAGARGTIAASPWFLNVIFYNLMYRLCSPRIPAMDRTFYATDACDRCDICETICPVANIERPQGRPVWKHRCEQCMACLQWCPREAIQFGSVTTGRRRYRHPDIRPADLTIPR